MHLSALPTRCVGILLARLNTAHFADAKPQNPQGSITLAVTKSQRHPCGCLWLLVEAAGIEPASESHLIQLSPSAAVLLGFPSRIADRQAMRYGSHYAVTESVATLRSRSPLIDASLPTAVLRGKTGSLIRPPTQLYCCRLLFKKYRFYSGSAPLLAYRTSQPPSKPLRPRMGNEFAFLIIRGLPRAVKRIDKTRQRKDL